MENCESRRVFFLYPHSVFQEHLLDILVQGEFEVAIVNDHSRIHALLARFPNSILFINVEHRLQDTSWEKFIANIFENETTRHTRIGVLAYNPDPELTRKYIVDIGIQCGVVTLKLGIKESAAILLKTLAVNDARGRRKYVRAKCPSGKGSLNIRLNLEEIKGQILDISSAGFAAVLDTTIDKETECDDVQLNLWGTRLQISCRCYGSRTIDSGEVVYIFLFEPALYGVNRSKVHQFIKRIIQSETDNLIRK